LISLKRAAKLQELGERSIACYTRALEFMKAGKHDEAKVAQTEGDELQKQIRQLLQQTKDELIRNGAGSKDAQEQGKNQTQGG
jgi:hypothetical protein